ncbi:bestrophin [Frateuria sp. Soil773]|uniref:bestrophin family protein n=1 Tax=Frateuria sp. Soil773 TaxID=1736407 RepID=UPI0006FCB212|nr:bestrophin family ion channel [Frateuria sp. Soil773]KRE89015.1 bestrophin [Frateuria sp. Soil773]
MIVRPHQTHSVATLLFALRGSIVPIIWPRVLYTMLLSLAVVVAERHGIAVAFNLNPAPLTLLGLALAIFLQFRNSVAYQRWWEGRTLWGDLLIGVRNLTRQTEAFMPSLAADKRRTLVFGLIGFMHALRHHLRGTPWEDQSGNWLGRDVREQLETVPNRANAVLGFLGRAYAGAAREVGLDNILLAQMDRELNNMSRVLGGCERLKNTPIPFAYILLLHRTVHVYCFMLPFCLIGPLGYFTPVVVGVIAYTFFGLDAIGEQIEEPFGMLPNSLPLDAMCRTAEIDLLGMLGESGLPPAMQPENFVLL